MLDNYNPAANTLQTIGGEIDTSFRLGVIFQEFNNLTVIFDPEDCVLESAVFYAQFPNSIKFEVRISLNTIIDDTTLKCCSRKTTVGLKL